tara:strand:+ start:2950 stop:3561 length:612 start_codon:yes stop_codon:yes gene_type:complete
MNWHTDGAFVTAEGEMTSEQVAMHIGLYGFVDLLTEAIARLVAIGWMSDSQCDPETLAKHSRDSRERIAIPSTNQSREDHDTCHEPIARDLRSHNSTEHDKTIDDNTNKKEEDPVRWLKTKGWQGMTADKIAELSKAYPSVDVPTELLRMNEWLKANPSKARKRQWMRFITNWIGRSNDTARPAISARATESASWGQEASSNG